MPRRFLVPAVVVAALAAPLAAPASALGAGSVRDGGGQYLVSAGAGGSATDSAMEFDTASFSDSVSATSAEGPPRSTASSGMVASVTDATDQLTFDGNATLACQQPAGGPGSGASARFERTFDVLAPGGVRFDGTITASGTSLNAFLLDANEQVVFGVDDPGSDSASGTLAPGEYSLVIQVNCLVETFTADAASTSGGFDVVLEVGGGGDRDGDGLLDDWELNGYDPDGPGGRPELDLSAMGAKVDHKDVFLELDFMAPHRLDQAGIAEVIQAFASAPVSNPDGTTGIELHVDNGSGSVMDPSSGALWGSRSDQDEVAHQAVLGSVTSGPDGEYDWGEFDVLKLANFADEREAVFHYAISAHAHDGKFSGIARDIPSSDLLVTLGAGCLALRGSDCTLGPRAQAGTLMHELGHNLGLRHGGDDDINKPNYLSVMNYAFQLGGLLRSDGSTRLDYSRFVLPSLNESALDETHGFGQSVGSEPAHYTTLGFCASGPPIPWHLVDGRLDFDCDSAVPEPGTVSSDVNRDGKVTVLDGFVDWPNLVYNGGSVGGSGVALPSQTELIEPPFEELLLGEQAIEAYAASLRGTPGSGGGPSGTVGGGGGSSEAAPMRLSGLRIKPASFRSATIGRSIVRRGGAKVTYRLSGAAAVTFRVERRKGGRWVRVRGSFKQAGRAGANSLRFSGRVGGKRLRAGRYRLVATPQGGPPARAAFRVR